MAGCRNMFCRYVCRVWSKPEDCRTGRQIRTASADELDRAALRKLEDEYHNEDGYGPGILEVQDSSLNPEHMGKRRTAGLNVDESLLLTRLPRELRDRIWELALGRPTVQICRCSNIFHNDCCHAFSCQCDLHDLAAKISSQISFETDSPTEILHDSQCQAYENHYHEHCGSGISQVQYRIGTEPWFRTCKQIHQETQLLVYSQATFVFDSTYIFQQFVESIGCYRSNAIKNVVISQWSPDYFHRREDPEAQSPKHIDNLVFMTGLPCQKRPPGRLQVPDHRYLEMTRHTLDDICWLRQRLKRGGTASISGYIRNTACSRDDSHDRPCLASDRLEHIRSLTMQLFGPDSWRQPTSRRDSEVIADNDL